MRRAALLLVAALLIAGCDFSGQADMPSERRASLEIFDMQADLVDPSIDVRGFPVAVTARPSARAGTTVVTCGPQQAYCPGASEAAPSRTYYYRFRNQPDLTSTDFALGEARQDFDSATGEPIVLLEFTPDGARRFETLTRRLARQSQSSQLALVVDKTLLAAPSIDARATPVGIEADRGIQITGLSSVSEARALARTLRRR